MLKTERFFKNLIFWHIPAFWDWGSLKILYPWNLAIKFTQHRKVWVCRMTHLKVREFKFSSIFRLSFHDKIRYSIDTIRTDLNISRTQAVLPKHSKTIGCCAKFMMIGNVRWTSAGNKYQADWLCRYIYRMHRKCFDQVHKWLTSIQIHKWTHLT